MFQARTITVTRRRLPHWNTEEGTYFVTFRLFDSLPRDVAARLRPKEIEEALDRGCGSAFMLNPDVATTVFGVLKFFHGDRYLLHSTCIMPNHVHAVFRTSPRVRMHDVIQSWKSFSAKRANIILGRTGAFWQRDWFDSLIRDEKRLAQADQYVMANPAKAGLVDWPWVEKFDTPFYVKYEKSSCV